MRVIRITGLLLFGAAVWASATHVRGQVVINEIVEDEQDFESTDVTDNREFIELYNAGSTAVNVGGYTMNYWLLGTSATTPGSYFASHDTIPSGTTLAPHAFYVIGADSVPNVNQPLGSNIDLFPNLNTIFELRSGPNVTDPLVDAVGLDTFRTPELLNATQEQLDQMAHGQTVSATARGGIWGQIESDDAIAPNVPLSIGRYLDGRDTNDNGRDFGMLPVTPGASNNLPQHAVHVVPNVDSMNIGDVLGTQYYASFKLPRVIDPMVVDSAGNDGGAVALNPKQILRSPQGGNAIVAYDETGGGNAVYSKEYVNKFDLYAYIDTSALNTNQTTTQNEETIYGLGTTDPFFATSDSTGLLASTSTANGSTG
ncbi:MAG TPA: lamin tail domain-containing protein, partial [Lacipirellulaceae bacterium]|nr:lamin tail domain-containing protein [Lacipirellulaceae bacterium]